MIFGIAQLVMVRLTLLGVFAVGYGGGHVLLWWFRRMLRQRQEEAAKKVPLPTAEDQCIQSFHEADLKEPINADPPVLSLSELMYGAGLASSGGERDYVMAQKIPHARVPRYDGSDEYLNLLGKSAKSGYAPALEQMAEYAWRRGAWVEAYFWAWHAFKRDRPDLTATLNSIRDCWLRAGMPEQDDNIHPMFSKVDGSIGRALLDVEVKRNVDLAKAYLKSQGVEL